jgi:hypothetical protein
MQLSTSTVKVALIDTGTYTFDAADSFYSDISAGVVATSSALSSKSITGGIFDAADVTFTALTGDSIEAVVVYVDTGDPATSPLILWIDEGNFPITPNGGDQTIVWSNDTNKIFRV